LEAKVVNPVFAIFDRQSCTLDSSQFGWGSSRLNIKTTFAFSLIEHILLIAKVPEFDASSVAVAAVAFGAFVAWMKRRT
jgi:hypothetical protein